MRDQRVKLSKNDTESTKKFFRMLNNFDVGDGKDENKTPTKALKVLKEGSLNSRFKEGNERLPRLL